MVTYGGESGEVFDLKEAIAGATKEATVRGSEMVLRAQISIGAISRSMTDANSFGRSTKHVIKNLLNSSFKKHETQLFYGQSGIAKIKDDAAAVDATAKTIEIAVAEWASGIFAGGEGMKLEIYDETDSASRAGYLKITKVDIANRKLTLDDSAFTYTLAQLDADVTAGNTVSLYEYGAYGNEFAGLHKILSTTTGNVFGINTASYSLWNGNTYAVGGAALTFDHISNAVALSVAKGLEGKLTLFVNPVTWADLLSEQTAKRVFDSKFDNKKYENGSESIMFHSQNGVIEIMASTYVKEGYAYGLDLETFERVGSSEITFKIPGSSDDFMIKMEGKNALEFRTYCDIALFCNALGHNLVISGIIN